MFLSCLRYHDKSQFCLTSLSSLAFFLTLKTMTVYQLPNDSINYGQNVNGKTILARRIGKFLI